MPWYNLEKTTLICNSSGCISLRKNNLITHNFLELVQFLESRSLIGQDKVGHAWPGKKKGERKTKRPSRKTKPIGWL